MTRSVCANLSITVLFLVASACGDSGTDSETGSSSDTSGTSAGSETGETTAGGGPGFTLSGTAVDLFTTVPLGPAEGAACVSIVDPIATQLMGEPVILTSSTVNTDGSWSVPGIETDNELGLLVLVHDCDNSGTLLLPSASGIAGKRYVDLGDGGEYSDFTAWVLDVDTVAGTDAQLTTLGAAATIAADGAVIGYVLDQTATRCRGRRSAARAAPPCTTATTSTTTGSSRPWGTSTPRPRPRACLSSRQGRPRSTRSRTPR